MVAKRGPVSPGAVSRRLNVEKSTISRNIARMKLNGWLAVADGASGREQRLTLTRKGEALVVKVLPVWKEAQVKATALLGQSGADSLRNLGNTVWSQIGRN